jgi:hypothetical protein
MKSIQKVTRVQLKVSQSDDILLVGLVSADPDYKLSLSLNKKFGISLKSIIPIKLIDETGSELLFSRFSDSGGSHEITYSLISNRSGKSFLLKKLKNVDFILQLHDPENESNIIRLTSSLREIESVNAVFNINIDTFRDKNLHYLIQ